MIESGLLRLDYFFLLPPPKPPKPIMAAMSGSSNASSSSSSSCFFLASRFASFFCRFRRSSLSFNSKRRGGTGGGDGYVGWGNKLRQRPSEYETRFAYNIYYDPTQCHLFCGVWLSRLRMTMCGKR